MPRSQSSTPALDPGVEKPPIPILLMVRELNLGGCERDLTKIAISLDRARYTPYVGCFHPQGFRLEELRAAGVPVVQFPVKSFAAPSTLEVAREFGRFIARHRIQIVHTFDVPSNIFGVPAARWYGVPSVIASHLWYRDLIPTVHRRMHPLVDRLAHKIVVNSDAVRLSLQRDLGIASSKIYLSHNGVDTRIFYPGTAKENLKDSLVIGTLCALRREKRVDVLIDAFRRVRSVREDVKLLIVGSGEMLPSLMEQCRSLDLEQSCTFEPATQDAAQWLRKMDVFVLSSESESFPNALLEAMACGCCVAASRVGGVPELVKDGVNGLMFSANDTAALADILELVARDSSLRATLAAAAVRTAHEDFPIQRAVERLDRLYQDMSSRNMKPASAG